KPAGKRAPARKPEATKPAAKKAAAKKPAAKKAAAKKPAAKKARKPNAAFMKALTPSAALASIVGDKPLPRTEVVKRMWDYIKKFDLQDKVNKRLINADDKLRQVFGKAQVNMFEMTSLVGKHLRDSGSSASTRCRSAGRQGAAGGTKRAAACRPLCVGRPSDGRPTARAARGRRAVAAPSPWRQRCGCGGGEPALRSRGPVAPVSGAAVGILQVVDEGTHPQRQVTALREHGVDR